jgi:hypothetical protein
MVMGLEVLVDQVNLTVLRIVPLAWKRSSNARNVELPRGRLR